MSDEVQSELDEDTASVILEDGQVGQGDVEILLPTTTTLPPLAAMQLAIPAGRGNGALINKAAHPPLSPIVTSGGESAARRFLEFFTVTIRNPHTRRAYYRAVSALLDFCEERGIVELGQIQPMMIAGFIEIRTREKSAPTVKQELAAIRQMFDYLVTGHIVDTNPAAAVRGPRYSIAKGKTPVLVREEAKKLLLSIPITRPLTTASGEADSEAPIEAPIYKVHDGADREGNDRQIEAEIPCLVGLRDRALIGLMVYSFARVGAVTKLKVGDYSQRGKRCFVGLHEKGGKYHELPVHHMAEEYIDAYLAAAGITAADKEQRKTPLFRTSRGWSPELSDKGMTPSDVLYMVKRRAEAAGLSPSICCHTFRATGITAYLENGGTVENAQNIANHADPRTTRLYDRRSDKISLTEIERIQL